MIAQPFVSGIRYGGDMGGRAFLRGCAFVPPISRKMRIDAKKVKSAVDGVRFAA
jgi:hypothetical protein